MNEKGANKTSDLKIEMKTGNTNLRFRGGAYCEVVLPLLYSWYVAVGNTVKVNDTEISIIEHEIGSEITNKHVDTKITVMIGDIRLVLHAYNSSQNLMVQGKNHNKFVDNCLGSFFFNKIEESEEHIRKVNHDIKGVLGIGDKSK